MPIYEIEGPDGKTYEIEGPAGATREQVIERVKATMSAPPPAAAPDKPSSFVDSVRSLPGGLAKGVAGVMGLPRDLNDLATAGIKWAGNKMSPGAGDKITDAFLSMPGVGTTLTGLQLPGSKAINEGVSKPFGGYYDPKTTAGEYAQTAASFAPAAIGGGGGLLAKGARVLVPAVGSETAGQLTKGTRFEPTARALGAIAGGVAVGGISGAIQARKNAAPTAVDLRNKADSAYKAAEVAGVVVNGKTLKERVAAIAAEAEEAGLDPTLHPKATAALKRLADLEGDPSLKKLETMRRVVNGAAGSIDKDERRLAYIIRDGLDDFVENMKPGDVIGGNADEGIAALKDARGLWSKVAKNEIVEKAITKAKNRGETVNGSGLENALRIEFRKIAQNDKIMRRFSPEEQAAIKSVSTGNITANTMRRLGSFAPTGLKGLLASGMGTNAGAVVGSLVGGPAGGMIGGATGGALVAGAGQASKKIAEAMTMGRARQAGEVMRRGAATQKPQNSRALLIDALLSQQGAHR